MNGRPMSRRIVCQFSCGAASACATKLAISQAASRESVLVVNAFIAEEHPDNRRFLADCERWFGVPITVLRDHKYGASTDEVWRRKQYFSGRMGAPCSGVLKRTVLDAIKRPDDIMVLGYTAEEQERYDDFQERWPELLVSAPLIVAGLTKSDCYALIGRAGIVLPEPYRLGFNNANCMGCCKGGEGYWNKVRVVWPERFAAVMAIQEAIGPAAYTFRNRKTGERYGLAQLPANNGRIEDEPEISCSVFCEIAAGQLERFLPEAEL